LLPERADAPADTLPGLGEAALIALGVGGRNNEQNSGESESNHKATEATSHGTPLFSNTDGTVIITYAEQISRVQHILVSLEIDERGFIFLISRFLPAEGSWPTGKEGVPPSLIMPAHPEVGQVFNSSAR